MSDEIHKGSYYKLTEEDRKSITKYFAKGDLGELIEFCEALSMCASFRTWENAESYLKEVGFERFFRDCNNCANTFECTPKCALYECGNDYKRWTSMTKADEKRLQKLRENFMIGQ